MQGNEERWKDLCAQAAVEQDATKLLALVAEINKLLDEKQNRLNRKTAPKNGLEIPLSSFEQRRNKAFRIVALL